MSIMDAAKQHFDDVLSADPKPILIEEWGGTFYKRPQISAKKKFEITNKMNAGQTDEGFSLALIYYLIDAEGNPVFKKADLFEMVRSIDPDVLIRVAGEIADMQPSQEDIEGN